LAAEVEKEAVEFVALEELWSPKALVSMARAETGAGGTEEGRKAKSTQ
jgi:hypothetical protein